MRASISQVAKLAGVSVATVSNVLSGKKYVSEELTNRVEEAVKELEYQPSRLARGLKEQKTYLIGLMVPDITNPFFAEIARGVENIALRHDYQVFLCNTDGNVGREKKALDSLLSYNVDGIVNVAPRLGDSEITSYLSRIPHVIVDRPSGLNSPRLGLVYVDNAKASKKLAAYLLMKGHRRFVCLSGPSEVANVQNRLDGFLKEVFNKGVHERDCLVKHGEFKYETGYGLMTEILKSDFCPTAVFAGNDLMAWGALDAIKQTNLSVPNDIAVVGFDNVYFSSFLMPSLTTINQPKFAMGEIAMNMLLDLMSQERGSNQVMKPIVLDCELIERDSG